MRNKTTVEMTATTLELKEKYAKAYRFNLLISGGFVLFDCLSPRQREELIIAIAEDTPDAVGKVKKEYQKLLQKK